MLFNYPLQQADIKASVLSAFLKFCDAHKTYFILGIVGLALLLSGYVITAFTATITGCLAVFIREIMTGMPNLDLTSVNDEFDLQDVIDDMFA